MNRRFYLGAAFAAAHAPVMEIARATGPATVSKGPAGNIPYPPIPPSASVIDLPADQYMHRGAPTEWWWHTGTLTSGDRVFGFEINAASFEGQGGIGFSQIMLTDVATQTHYQRTTPYLPPLNFLGSTWAQFDPTRDWAVQLGNPNNYLSAIDVVNPGSGYTSEPFVKVTGTDGGELAFAWPVVSGGQVQSIWVLSPGIGFKSTPTVTITGGGGSGATAKAVHTYVTMNAPWGQAMSNMSVKALLNDQATGTEVMFDLVLSQMGPPFIVWGTGYQPFDPSAPGGHLHQNNYYYSLTRLQAQGSISIGGEDYPVTGVTWMDHEYGAFGHGSGPKWILQDMQLSNGVHISNSTGITSPPTPGVPFASHATVQRADGTTYLVPSTITLSADPAKQWYSEATKNTYYLEIQVDVEQFGASLTVSTLCPNQEFPVASSPIYEGVAIASGTFEGKQVSGTAWNEQAPVAKAS